MQDLIAKIKNQIEKIARTKKKKKKEKRMLLLSKCAVCDSKNQNLSSNKKLVDYEEV